MTSTSTEELEVAMVDLDARADELRAQLKADETDLAAKTDQAGEFAADGDAKQAAAVEKAIDQLRQLIARGNQALLVLGRRRETLSNDLAASRLADAHIELAALEAETITLLPALAGAVDDMLDAWGELHKVAQNSRRLASAYPRDLAPHYSGYAYNPPQWWPYFSAWRADLQETIDRARAAPLQ